MKSSLIDTVLDWPTQQGYFEPDGSLLDIYVQNANVEDWQVVLARIFERDFQARLSRDGNAGAMPSVLDDLFDFDNGYLLCFRIGDIAVDCHFFEPTEIELSFWPEQVTETSLPHLLNFMIELGELTKKPVIMTPENFARAPLFRYVPDQQQLRWERERTCRRTGSTKRSLD